MYKADPTPKPEYEPVVELQTSTDAYGSTPDYEPVTEAAPGPEPESETDTALDTETDVYGDAPEPEPPVPACRVKLDDPQPEAEALTTQSYGMYPGNA